MLLLLDHNLKNYTLFTVCECELAVSMGALQDSSESPKVAVPLADMMSYSELQNLKTYQSNHL